MKKFAFSLLSIMMLSVVVTSSPAVAETVHYCNGYEATIVGTEGNDYIIGTDGKDVIVSLGGSDVIRGERGADIICGGDSRDRIWGNAGFDTIFGFGGNDVITGNLGDDYIDGGSGKDRIIGSPGNDEIHGGPGPDIIYGGDGDDYIDALGGDNKVYGEAGNDTILARLGDDQIHGGDGEDTITVNGGNNEITGDDNHTNRKADTVIVGGNGTNNVYVWGGNDYVELSGGTNFVDAGAGDDVILGGAGTDTIRGRNGHDRLVGNAGSDYLWDDSGNNIIEFDNEDELIRANLDTGSVNLCVNTDEHDSALDVRMLEIGHAGDLDMPNVLDILGCNHLRDSKWFEDSLPEGTINLGEGLAYYSHNGVHVAYINVYENNILVSPESPQEVGAYGGRLAINGAWYDTNGSIGFQMSNNNVYGTPDSNILGTAYFQTFDSLELSSDNMIHITDHNAINDSDLTAKYEQAVSGYPTLVVDSELYEDLNLIGGSFATREPRTAFGYNTEGIAIFMVLDGRQPGLPGFTGVETAELIQYFGAEYALMLDGGGSAQMIINGTQISSSTDDDRLVYNQLYVQ